VQVSGSYDTRHCHGLTGIAGYIVVRTSPGPASDGGPGEARTDLAVLEGAWQYPRAREQVRSLYAGLGGQAGVGEEFRVDVVYADGCRMPW
jgi:hypothetical protein